MRRGAIAILFVLTVLVLLDRSWPTGPAASEEGDDERVLLYPSYLTWDREAKTWRGSIEGRVYEPGRGAGARMVRVALRTTLGAVAVPAEEDERTLEARLDQFAVDSERGKRVVVEIGGRSFVSRRSEGSGHFRVEVALAEIPGAGATPFRARIEREGARAVEGIAPLVGPEGVSVISDVDDTVKESRVLDRRELVANTFYRPYRAVAGMPELYAGWRERGVAIHYVTASPWQLFPSLWGFLEESGLVGASIAMREIRLANASAMSLFRDSRPYKTGRIREILERFPARAFVLVGDSGERDPDVYAAIAREHPRQVRGVFIRAVLREHLDRSRYREVFSGIDETRWIVFAGPEALPRDLAGWVRGDQ